MVNKNRGTPNNKIVRHHYPDGTVVITVGNQYIKINVDKYNGMVPDAVDEYAMEPEEVKEFQAAYNINPKATMKRLKLTNVRDKKTRLLKVQLATLVLDKDK